MSKPRICKTCKWLHHRVEPCCSCLRWGKGKTDYYIPAEETLGEYLERKEREDNMETDVKNMTTEKLLDAMAHCLISGECTICPYWKGKGVGCSFENEDVDLMNEAYKHLKALRQELIDERDRYDRLVSFELEEAELLREAKTASAEILRCAQNDKLLVQGGENTSSTADAVPLPLKGKVNGGDDTVRRCADFLAEKLLQTSDVPPDQQAKADAGKPQLCMVPRQIIRDIAEVREYGNRKYGDPENWRTVSVERYRNAAFRHWLAYLDDPAGVDAESGISHLKHLACNIAFLCELENANE